MNKEPAMILFVELEGVLEAGKEVLEAVIPDSMREMCAGCLNLRTAVSHGQWFTLTHQFRKPFMFSRFALQMAMPSHFTITCPSKFAPLAQHYPQ